MRYGYWLPVFGGWLRNVADENMEASWTYVKKLAQRSEQIGYDLTLIAELNLNDIKGVEAPSLDAWSTAAALAAVTERIELMVAVRPTFHLPALLAKQAANIDQHQRRAADAERRVVVVGGRSEEVRRGFRAARRPLRAHQRMARCAARRVVAGSFFLCGKVLPRRRQCPRAKARRSAEPHALCGRRIAGGEGSHRGKVRRLSHARRSAGARRRKNSGFEGERRARHNLPPLKFGVAGYAIVRETEREAQDELKRITDVQQSAAGYANYQQWLAGTQLEQRVSLEDYSVSNRGLRSGLVGTPEQVSERLAQFEAAGVDLVLLQFSPQLEEMERFAESCHSPKRLR